MNIVDLVLIALIVASTFGAYRLGLIARVSSWIGLAVGLIAAVQVAPVLVRNLGGRPSARVFFVALLFIGLSAIGASLGELFGRQVRRMLPHGPLRQLDRLAGAAAGAVGVILLLWLLLPTVAEAPGGISRMVRSSSIAQTIHGVLPRPPDTLQTLRRLISDSDFPQVFADLRPAPDTGPPPAGPVLAPEVQQRVAQSTVKVSARGCGRIQEGSGFSPRPDTIVTNAHVVSGADRVEVLRPDGRRLPAEVVVFDSDRDLAVLRVPNLNRPPLPVGEGEAGTDGAVFGHPHGQTPLEVSPARVTERVTAVGRDIYNEHRTRRDVFFLAAELSQGDSGGALVDPGGTVIGVAFAVSPDRPQTAYALTDTELRAVLAIQPAGAASTGRCIA